jgi:hypothetical protein
MPRLREFSKYVQKDRFTRSFDQREHNSGQRSCQRAGFLKKKNPAFSRDFSLFSKLGDRIITLIWESPGSRRTANRLNPYEH